MSNNNREWEIEICVRHKESIKLAMEVHDCFPSFLINEIITYQKKKATEVLVVKPQAQDQSNKELTKDSRMISYKIIEKDFQQERCTLCFSTAYPSHSHWIGVLQLL